MRVSVIIATFNRRALLERTIPTLLAQDFPADQYEIIVVVDGSTDGSAEFLRGIETGRRLHVIEQPNRGQAAAINAGLREASGDLVLFLDDDILCAPTLVAEHAAAGRAGDSCLAYGPVLTHPATDDQIALDWARSICDEFFETTAASAPEFGWAGCMASANSSAPRRVILSAGGLDESFTQGNDLELGLRLGQRGLRFSYLPGAVAHQIIHKGRHDVVKDASGGGIAELRLCRKYPRFRANARIVKVWSEPWWRRAVTWALVTLPQPLQLLLNFVLSILARLHSFPACRAASQTLFRTQLYVCALRCAVGEVGSWSALRREFGTRLPVLMYHHIGPLREGFDPSLTVSPRMFERHLRWLSRHGYTPIRSADWIRFQLEGARVPEKPVLLTFDDGYADTAEFGLALLRKYGFTGTVFVVTDQIDGINAWDLHLGLSAQPLMTTEQIRYWASRGIEFGSHTRTHPDLRACTREQIVTELRGSRERLEGVTGDPVSVLAYPYGYFDESVADSARQFFAAALTCQQGVNHVTTDMMHLRRAEVVPKYAWFDIRFFVRFGRNPVRGFISRLRSIYRYFFPRTTSWSIGSTRN